MGELLHCPFCNCIHAPSVHTLEGGVFVWCDTNYGGCGVRGAVSSTDHGAIDAWNRRAPAAPGQPRALGWAWWVCDRTGPARPMRGPYSEDDARRVLDELADAQEVQP